MRVKATGYVTRKFNGGFTVLYHSTVRTDSQKSVPQYVSDLKTCTKTHDLEAGKKIHEDIIHANLHTDRYVAPALINMYSKCRTMSSAKEVFDCMILKNVIAWNALMFGYMENGQDLVALDVFSEIDCKPNSVTYIAALKACKGLSGGNDSERKLSLELGASIHRQVDESGLESDVVVATTLMDMYCKIGKVELAREIFDKTKTRTVVTWNVLMLGYVENKRASEALDLFMNMSCTPTSVSYIAVLKALKVLSCERVSERQACLLKGISVHKEVEIRGLETDISVATTLLDMYFTCGCVHRGRDLFQKIKLKSVVTWNTVIRGYVENGDNLLALELFSKMACAPSDVTFLAALKACRGLADQRAFEMKTCLEKGMEIHKQLNANGFGDRLTLLNSLISMYGTCQSPTHARDVFEGMKNKDVVTWTSLIVAYLENGDSLEAMNVFTSMDCEPDSFTYAAVLKACAGLASQSEPLKHLRKGISIHRKAKARGLESDVVVGNSLLDMYSKYGRMIRGKKVFDRMLSKDTITWNSLILGYVDNNEPTQALELFRGMDRHPDCFTYVAALKACTSLTTLQDGLPIHAIICRLGLDQDGVIVTALMDLYAKCGHMSRTEELFNGMSSRDIVSWNALVTGYSNSGEPSQVVSLAREMEEGGLGMDGVTLTCILAACSHTGLVEEGKRYFESVRRRGLVLTVDHCNCMVDLLGRANRLSEALALVKSMPFAADCVTWTALLGACKKWRNLEVGKVAFDALVVEGGTRDSAAFVLMRDIYTSVEL